MREQCKASTAKIMRFTEACRHVRKRYRRYDDFDEIFVAAFFNLVAIAIQSLTPIKWQSTIGCALVTRIFARLAKCQNSDALACHGRNIADEMKRNVHIKVSGEILTLFALRFV